MNQLQPSELVKSVAFPHNPFLVFLHYRNTLFPTQEENEIPDVSRLINPLSAPKNLLTGEVDEPPVEQWLIEPGTIIAFLTNKHPGFDQADQGGSHD